jgi:hypothetical protein
VLRKQLPLLMSCRYVHERAWVRVYRRLDRPLF